MTYGEDAVVLKHAWSCRIRFVRRLVRPLVFSLQTSHCPPYNSFVKGLFGGTQTKQIYDAPLFVSMGFMGGITLGKK